jgi:hypothetical protein
MKVRGLTGPDYWLPTWTIYSTSTLVVTMSFRSEQLADFALAAFPAA